MKRPRQVAIFVSRDADEAGGSLPTTTAVATA